MNIIADDKHYYKVTGEMVALINLVVKMSDEKVLYYTMGQLYQMLRKFEFIPTTPPEYECPKGEDKNND